MGGPTERARRPPAAGAGAGRVARSPPARSRFRDARLAWRAAPGCPSAELPAEHGEELRVAHQVATPHALRLARQAIEPLEPRARHPARSARHFAGDEIERGADAEEHRRAKCVAPAMDPDLLLGR